MGVEGHPFQRRTGTDVDRARRLAALTRARLRLAVLETPSRHPWATLRPVRRAVAAWRLQRHALSAVEHLSLGSDPAITSTITATVAAVVGLAEATNPTALPRSSADPWIRSAPAIVAEPIAYRSDPHPAPVDQPAEPSTPPASDRTEFRSRSTDPRSESTNGRRPTARPDDVSRLRDAIATGALDPTPTVDAIRRHLQISPNHARAARAAALTPTVTSRNGQQENSNHQENDSGASSQTHAITSGINGKNHVEKDFQQNTTHARESPSEQGTHAVRLP